MATNIETVLIARPKAQGALLATELQAHGFHTYCQPLFNYRLTTNNDGIYQHLQQYQPQIVIFVSVAAVEFANKAMPLSQWQQIAPLTTIIAVGPTTQQQLSNLGINSISPEQHNSEGMLALASLTEPDIEGFNVTIVRGEDGRELLAEQLTTLGAKVNYLSVYEKCWQALPDNTAQQWRQHKVNCVIATSEAILKSLVHLVDISDNHWRCYCVWLVASERIAIEARKLGLERVINCHGATNSAILTTLLNMDLTDDRP